MGNSIFINWTVDDNSYSQVDFFDLPDLAKYDIAFFDPLGFALKHGLRENSKDIAISEYKRLDKNEFIKIMAGFKSAGEKLRSFLRDDGLLVVKSNLPNSYIQVRSSAAQGTQKFTESVLSVNFWLEDFIGKYSFLYRMSNTVNFAESGSVLSQNLKGSPIRCRQSHDIIPEGEVTVIARSAPPASFPILSRVSLNQGREEIVFIPELSVKNECRFLESTLLEYKRELKTGVFRPSWMARYEKELEINSPFKDAIEQLNQEIGLLEKRKLILVKHQNKFFTCAGLLHKAGDELIAAAKTAFRLLGFECIERCLGIEGDSLGFCIKYSGDLAGVVQVDDTETGAIDQERFLAHVEKLQGLKTEKSPKFILLANTDRVNIPDGRPQAFDDDVLEANNKAEYCLLSAVELFNVVQYLMTKSNSEILETIRASLRKDILNCSGQFSIDERKYLVRKQTQAIRVR